jgi:two-component system phosphate regulon sensor histidine kinase PhoR
MNAVEAAADGVFLLSLDAKYLAANAAFYQFLGATESSLLGKSYYDALSDDSIPLAHRAIETMIQRGQSQRTTVVFRREDGETRTAECHQSFLFQEGRPWCIVTMARDISQEVILERKLWDAAEEHRAALDFALRTSLGLIKGYVCTLYQHSNIDEARRGMYVQIIEEEVERLTKFTEDLLDYRRLEVGELYGSEEPVDVVGLVKSVLSGFQREAMRRQIQVETQFQKMLRPLFTSQESLRRIFINLLQNAILYTPAGGTIKVSVLDSEDFVETRVEDNGPGIPSEDIGSIFEKFYRGRAADKAMGTGLGLAIARTLAESLGGRIDVESQPGRGSVFRLRLYRKGWVARSMKDMGESTEEKSVRIAIED